MIFKLEKQSYIFFGAFAVILGIYFLLPGTEALRAGITAGIAIFSIVLYIILVERNFKKKPAPGQKKSAVTFNGNRIKRLFSEWQWIQVASILCIVGFLGVVIFKLALWPVIYMVIMSFVGFGLIEYARISKK